MQMAELKYDKKSGRILFTKEMRREYKILAPNMLPVHFKLFEKVLQRAGYDVEVLKNDSHRVVEEGLKHVHNDTCYPALLVIGQMIDALNSGKYDVEKTALMITQTGGGCRASNYIHLLRKALKSAGYEQVPVISVNLSGLESNPGFTITPALVMQFVASLVYGDLLMLLNNQVKAYEVNVGESEALVDSWVDRLLEQFARGKGMLGEEFRANLRQIADEFDAIPVNRVPKVKVGVVGEIYVKYSPLANNHLEEFLASQDCEVMVPGLMGFVLFKVDNRLDDIRLYGGSSMKYKAVSVLKEFCTKMESAMLDALKDHPHFTAPSPYAHLRTLVNGVVGYGSKMGEGWLLTAEMLELCESGYENIVCTQPFGCLPNHINGKGMIGRIRKVSPNANITPIDYDPSATKVNQENRIKLMLAVARENLAERLAAEAAEATQAAKTADTAINDRAEVEIVADERPSGDVIEVKVSLTPEKSSAKSGKKPKQV